MPYVARATRLFVPFFIFLTCFVALFISGNDPTSLFYRAPRDPEKQWPYSSFRRAEASSIIEEAISIHNSGVNDTSAILKASPSQPPELCIGIATVARPNARYFSSAVGSLLHHLSPEERARIHLVLLVAHIDQRNHPAWSEGWVQILADTLLTYDTLPDAEIDRVKEMEVEGGEYRRKGLYDYAYLLDTCMQTGAPNVLVLEDDVVAMDGWFARTRAAVQAAHSVGKDWLYLRLFYTDTFMGWNGESWGTYLFHSVQAALLVAIATALAHFATFRSSNQGPSLRLHGPLDRAAPSIIFGYRAYAGVWLLLARPAIPRQQST
ncbi:hypothetical protein FH972_022000 [Carpinus fangiana]|uniref:Uncharacterized protein n=1 Tax=Carpinus fangiana TaxID=176857 RepID=A0A5N6KRL4_9ROSI|nr:hypothetical protein FH972_022000 [Carpinus fangiana]